MSLMGLFSIGFIMGLTGAMAPGPLLTITIGESARRGGIVGPLVVLGHGILEFTLLVVIILGAANLLTSPVVYSFVAICGGFVLIYMGYGIIKNIKNYSLVPPPEKEKQGLHPVLIGVVVSLSNPYWFIWWITIGMGYIMFAGNLGVAGILTFFAGHIPSDLVWYSFISYGIQFGGRHVSLRAIKCVLFACSMFLIIFGLLFIIKGYNFIR